MKNTSDCRPKKRNVKFCGKKPKGSVIIPDVEARDSLTDICPVLPAARTKNTGKSTIGWASESRRSSVFGGG